MKALMIVWIAGMAAILGCQHNDRILEPSPAPAPASTYIQFQVGDSLGYGVGSTVLAVTFVDSILPLEGHFYFRFRNFPFGPGGVWPDLLLREDQNGNIKARGYVSSDSGTAGVETMLFQFGPEVGSTWTFDYGYRYLCTLESLTDTVIISNTAYLGCTRIRVGAYGTVLSEVYWLAPGVGVVNSDYETILAHTFIGPPGLLVWRNFPLHSPGR